MPMTIVYVLALHKAHVLVMGRGGQAGRRARRRVGWRAPRLGGRAAGWPGGRAAGRPGSPAVGLWGWYAESAK